ncbi:MAG: glycosyltransferase family 1 protein [Jatrophihabitans sp.]|nr:MAG: glycosyltransferase family 1 protein [Jatrophihabitans sp.]
MRVRFDGAAFVQHRWSGISRYLSELVGAFDAAPELGVVPVLDYRFVSTSHLAATRGGIRSLPLPRRLRRPTLDLLNRVTSRRAGPAPSLTHYPLYEPESLADARERPAVTTVYDFTMEACPGLFGDVGAHLAAKRDYLHACDALICISETTRRDLRRFHPDLDKPVVVTPLAVSPAFATASRARVRGLPERYLLHVGNRAQHKNIELVLTAFRELAAADPGLHLVLSGQGLPGERERIAELGIARRTHVVRLSDRALPAAYQRARALFFPSRYEGFGLPVLEAMTAGCPTVISDVPALVEVAGGAAEVVGVDDLDAAVTALDRVINDAAVAERRRADGRRRASAFSWHRTAAATAPAYQWAAASRGAGDATRRED